MMKHTSFRSSFAVAIVAASSFAFAACGGSSPKKGTTPAATKTATASNDTSTGNTPATDTVSAEAPTPPPPGDTSHLTGSAREAYDRGVAAYNAGDLAGAQTAFEQSISAEPKAYEAHYALGLTLEREGKNGEALTHYREAYTLNSNYEAAITAYGYLLYKQGSKTEAESFLSDQRAKNPKSVGIMTALAEIKSLQGDSAACQKLASDALTIEAKFEPAMVVKARDHFRRGRIELASYMLSAILDGQQTEDEKAKGLPAKANPPRAANNAEAHYLRAVILQKQGERLAAAKWFESAVKLRPDLVDAQLQLGLIRLEANDADGALGPLQKTIAYSAGNAEAHLALGEAYRLSSKQTQAKEQYNWVLGSAGAGAQLKALAQYDLGLLYFLTPSIDGLADPPRYDKAIQYFNQFKTAKGTSSGPSWPADADDLIEQARRLKLSAAAASGGGGSPKPKPAPATTTSSKPTTPPPAASSAAKTTTPPPAASSKPPAASSKGAKETF